MQKYAEGADPDTWKNSFAHWNMQYSQKQVHTQNLNALKPILRKLENAVSSDLYNSGMAGVRKLKFCMWTIPGSPYKLISWQRSNLKIQVFLAQKGF